MCSTAPDDFSKPFVIISSCFSRRFSCGICDAVRLLTVSIKTSFSGLPYLVTFPLLSTPGVSMGQIKTSTGWFQKLCSQLISQHVLSAGPVT